jgi:hypothetical protein
VQTLLRVPALRWPIPALMVWAAAWACFAGLRSIGVGFAGAACAAMLLGAAAGLVDGWGASPWRRIFLAAGFPLSLAASGVAGALAPWAWLVPLAGLALLYPLRSWSDAPLFPTPTGALRGLAAAVPLRDGARVVDAGCGLGAGLRELHAAYPRAQLSGWEWSRPLAWICARRCDFAQVRRVDIWAADWSGCDMVYLFQRPESMARAAAKAARELAPGAWLVSLEFEVPAHRADAQLHGADGRHVWCYRAAALRRIGA